MTHSTPAAFGLQSLLFSQDDLSSCFFRRPTDRELEFMSFFHSLRSLLSSDEVSQLHRYHIKGRTGYDLITMLGIQLLKIHYRQPTMKETLLLLQENENLREILGISQVPSTASASRLARKVGKVVKPTILHERVIQAYKEGMNRTVGHLSIDSTTIQAREKPFVRAKEVVTPATPATQKKRGRKKKGSPEERAYLEEKAETQRKKREYLEESPGKSLSELEMRCSMTAKQNSKGKRQWFIGYKAHLATDDFGVTIAFTVTGACVHDCKVAVPLMKTASQRTDFFYALMDKGYLKADINAYADMIGRKVIIDQRAHRSVADLPMEKAYAARYRARTTVERSNSELKDGFLPDKIYRKGSHARYDIELAILMTTMKKVWKMLLLKEESKATKAS
ncbi:MAG: transposase [Sphaerochaeta sp.]|nr:transposase [Sphaerochaeta sp.]